VQHIRVATNFCLYYARLINLMRNYQSWSFSPVF